MRRPVLAESGRAGIQSYLPPRVCLNSLSAHFEPSERSSCTITWISVKLVAKRLDAP